MEELGADWRIILKCLKAIACVDVDWIHPAQNTDKWQAICEHSNEHLGSIKHDENGDLETVNFNALVRIALFFGCFL